MELRSAALVVAVLLSGCADAGPRDEAPSTDPSARADREDAAVGQTRLRFASGDFEGNLSFTATFSSLDACLRGCTASASQSFDLTSVVPESAPVELAIVVDGTDGGIGALLVYDQAFASGESVTYQGTQIQLSAAVVRDPGGSVNLRLTRILPLTPSPDPFTVDVEVRAVVRPDQLLPRMPASLRLAGGDTLSISGLNVTQALLLQPNGLAMRSTSDELNLTLPGDAASGTYTLLVEGGIATVTGPNATLTARRLETVVGPFQPVTMGAETRWGFAPPAVPVQVGVIVRSQDDATKPNPFMGRHTASVAAPGGAVVVQGENACGLPMCQGGYFTFTYDSPFMDERLGPGTYSASVLMDTGDAVETAGFYVAVL